MTYCNAHMGVLSLQIQTKKKTILKNIFAFVPHVFVHIFFCLDKWNLLQQNGNGFIVTHKFDEHV